MKACIIVGAGAHYSRKPPANSERYIIAVDGGYEYLERSGIKADVVIGDFDSLSGIPKHSNIIRLNTEKDDTDMLAAIKYGLSNGYDEFHIYGGTGGRFDHTFANIQCLAYLSEHGSRGLLIGKDSIMTCIRDCGIDFDSSHRGIVSVFSLSNRARGVCLEGLKYELLGTELCNFYPLGVSNEFVGKASRISVAQGTLLIIYPYSTNLI